MPTYQCIKMKSLASCFTVSCLVFAPVYAKAEAVELNQAQQAFDKVFYQTQSAVDQAFELYQSAYNQAFYIYQKKIEANWDAAVVSTPKLWVTYKNEFKAREIVDFDKGRVILQSTGNTPPSDLETQIKVLLNKSYQTAFEEDEVSKKVEQTLVKEDRVAKAVVNAKPSEEKILPSMLMGNSQPTEAEIDSLAKQMIAKAKVQKKQDSQGNLVQTVVIPIDVDKVRNRKAKAYLDEIERYAAKEKVPESLVLAIMENESSFNPMAKSYIPAYGLMQIVPKSAGKDATAYLFGEQKLVSPSYLYTPNKNIEMGAAYLHILYYRYLRKIEDKQSRLYCTIAAYNTGAGNVARAFTGKYNVNSAAKEINQLSAQEVYDHLIKHLPYNETKRYLKKVNRSMVKYQVSI